MRLTGVLLAALLACLATAATAGAAVKDVGCAEVKSTIEGLSGEGETVVLNGLCTKAQLGATGIRIPAKAGLTLQAAPGTTSGIDGEGISGSLLFAEEAGAVTLQGLTFENAATTSVSPSAVSLRASRVTIIDDSFLDNREEGVSAAGLFVYAGAPGVAGCPGGLGGPAPITVQGSTFRGNSLTIPGGVGGGGAAFLLDRCPGAMHAIEGNVVEGNTIVATGAEEAVGAGLDVASEGLEAAFLSQRGNIFAANRIEASGGGSYGGGGEWLAGLNTTSVADRFSGNALPGASGARWSWGAGLGIVSCGAAPTQSTLEDTVVAGNAIAGGEPRDDGGAGIYVGCSKTAANRLSLLDSTVTENSAPAGGVAGIDGDANDSLALANTIVAADLGGEELGGFSGAGGIASASFSDVCVPGSVLPLSGEGDICAAPRLAGEGNPASVDVHETASSPTLETGSNALVPAGLTSDFYGAARIAGGTEQGTCFEGLAPVAAARVDIGAAELQEPHVIPLDVVCPLVLVRSKFAFPSVSIRPGGVMLLTFHGLGKGTVVANVRARVVRTFFRKVHGRRRRIRRTVTVSYGQAARTGALPATLQLRIRPGKKALATLRRRHRLRVSLAVTYAADRLFPTTQTRAVTVRWIAPHRKRHR